METDDRREGAAPASCEVATDVSMAPTARPHQALELSEDPTLGRLASEDQAGDRDRDQQERRDPLSSLQARYVSLSNSSSARGS